MNLVGYARVSTLRQKEAETIGKQIFDLNKYCQDNGHVMPPDLVFCEEGVSGSDGMDDRPAMNALLDYMALHAEIDGILIYQLDRLARDIVIQERFIQDCQKMGKRLLSVAEPDLDSTDPTRVLIRHLLGAVSQYEKGNIARRMTGGKLKKARSGGFVGGAVPYGYRSVLGELQVDGDKSPVVSEIFRLHHNGESLSEIARILNLRGIPPPLSYSGGGKRKLSGYWTHKTVGNILNNQIYWGVSGFKSVVVERPDLAIVSGDGNVVRRKVVVGYSRGEEALMKMGLKGDV